MENMGLMGANYITLYPLLSTLLPLGRTGGGRLFYLFFFIAKLVNWPLTM